MPAFPFACPPRDDVQSSPVPESPLGVVLLPLPESLLLPPPLLPLPLLVPDYLK